MKNTFFHEISVKERDPKLEYEVISLAFSENLGLETTWMSAEYDRVTLFTDRCALRGQPT